MEPRELLGRLRRAVRLTGDVEADLAQLGQVLRRDPALKAGFEALAHAVCWGEKLAPLGPKGYWLFLLIRASALLGKARGWYLRWETPWGKTLRYDRSTPEVTKRSLREAERLLEDLLASGGLRKEVGKEEEKEEGEEWVHEWRPKGIPAMGILLEAAEDVGVVSRYAPKETIRSRLEEIAASLERGEELGLAFLQALWGKVTREWVWGGDDGFFSQKKNAGRVARVLILGGYPRRFWGVRQGRIVWYLPHPSVPGVRKAVARAIRLSLEGEGALAQAYREARERFPTLPEVVDPGGRPSLVGPEREVKAGEETPLERLARLALEGAYGPHGALVFVITYGISPDEDAVASALAEALLTNTWRWVEGEVPLALWVREHVTHTLIKEWRGYDPHQHEDPDEEEPTWDGGLSRVEEEAVLARAKSLFGEEAVNRLLALAEELPPAPFSGPVPLEEFARWYLGQ